MLSPLAVRPDVQPATSLLLLSCALGGLSFSGHTHFQLSEWRTNCSPRVLEPIRSAAP